MLGLGCGCTLVGLLLVLCVPLLLSGAGHGVSASAGDPSSFAVAGGQTPSLVPAGGSACNRAVRCQPIPAALTYVPVGFFPDSFVNPPGQCTSWAAALWPGHRGRGVTWSGDAWEWYANAAAQGYAVAPSPSLGAIAVFAATGGTGGSWGHVAVVTHVAPTSFQVTEMNWVGRYVVDVRTLGLPTGSLTGFIPVPADAAP